MIAGGRSPAEADSLKVVELASGDPNVDLRRGPDGKPIVVLGFPYDPHIVAVVRQIPHRRFDWDTREWWAPIDDWAAVHVAEVLKRFPKLTTSAQVDIWLKGVGERWVGRVRTTRYDGRGWWVLDTRAGTVPEALLEGSVEVDGKLLAPLTQAGAIALGEARGAKLDGAAHALRARAGARRRGAARAAGAQRLGRGRGVPAGDAVGPDDRRRLRAAARHVGRRPLAAAGPVGRPPPRRLPGHPRRRRRRAGRARAGGPARGGGRGRGGDPPLPRHRGRAADRDRRPARRRAAAVPVGRRALRARRAPRLPLRRAGPGQDRPGAGRDGGRRRLPGDRHLPRVAEAQLAARDAQVAAAPLGRDRRGRRRGPQDRPTSRSSTTRSSASTTRRSRGCAPRRSSSTSRTTARTRAPSARRPCAGCRSRSPRAGCASR